MSYIVGFNRKQTALFPQAIDEIIEAENTVRFIDLFVDKLNIVEFGFKDVRLNINGRPPFNPPDLLKLYIYGYMNRIRLKTSQKMEQLKTGKIIRLSCYEENKIHRKSDNQI